MGKSSLKYIEEEKRQRYTNKDQNGRKQLQENLLRKMDDSIKEGKKETQKKKPKKIARKCKKLSPDRLKERDRREG